MANALLSLITGSKGETLCDLDYQTPDNFKLQGKLNLVHTEIANPSKTEARKILAACERFFTALGFDVSVEMPNNTDTYVREGRVEIQVNFKKPEKAFNTLSELSGMELEELEKVIHDARMSFPQERASSSISRA